MEQGREMRFGALLTVVVVLTLAGCGGGEGHKSASTTTKAIAVLNPTEGNTVQGVVSFTKTDKGIHIQAGIEGLAPGLHGFHIHEYGDCSSPDAASAGGHFNPGKMPHGAPNAEKHHAGDLGNIGADGAGAARLEVVAKGISFDGADSIIGRAMIVHASPDDFTTQPTGNAGARIACGVIGLAK